MWLDELYRTNSGLEFTIEVLQDMEKLTHVDPVSLLTHALKI